MNDVFILSAARTPIGSFGGALAHLSPAELGVFAARAALERARLNERGVIVDEVVTGNVLGAGHGMNVSRQIALKSGLPSSTPAYAVNKVCGSGLKAVALGAAEIAGGGAKCILAGGTESMSQAAHITTSARWGSKLGNVELRDLLLLDGLTDVFCGCHMGITAENIAERHAISREDQDRYALQSQQRTAAAVAGGLFSPEIVPIPIQKKGKPAGQVERDEHPRADTALEGLSALKPAFKNDGTVTAGNSSGINDGAAFVVLGDSDTVRRMGSEPLARIVSAGSAGVDPEVMGLGPVGAVKNALSRAGLRPEDIDVIEANEAFAVQALAVQRLLEWDPARVNTWGGAIALGHPIGASGARILVTLLSRLHHAKGRYGLATLCVGGGQGIALLVERLAR